MKCRSCNGVQLGTWKAPEGVFEGHGLGRSWGRLWGAPLPVLGHCARTGLSPPLVSGQGKHRRVPTAPAGSAQQQHQGSSRGRTAPASAGEAERGGGRAKGNSWLGEPGVCCPRCWPRGRWALSFLHRAPPSDLPGAPAGAGTSTSAGTRKAGLYQPVQDGAALQQRGGGASRNLISPGPRGPPQAQVPVGCVLLALGCAQLLPLLVAHRQGQTDVDVSAQATVRPLCHGVGTA